MTLGTTLCDGHSATELKELHTHEIILMARSPRHNAIPQIGLRAATAPIMDLTLVTADDSLLRLGTTRTMKN
jgi:hypothetical protein